MNIVKNQFTIKINGNKIKAELMNNVSFGYIYLNEWETNIESTYMLRDTIIHDITNNARSYNYFKFFCGLISHNCITPQLILPNSYKNKINKIINIKNRLLQQKLIKFDIRNISQIYKQ